MTVTTHRDSALATNAAFRLGRRARRCVLVAHIVSAGAWIGLDVVMGVFVFSALVTDDARTKVIGYQALEMFAVGPLLTVGLLCLVTGLVLGLGTKYGLVRFWWVAVKLVLNVVLVVLVILALRPGVVEAAESARRLSPTELLASPVGDLVFPPIVSTTALVIATAIAVFKPWGRIRGGQQGTRYGVSRNAADRGSRNPRAR